MRSPPGGIFREEDVGQRQADPTGTEHLEAVPIENFLGSRLVTKISVSSLNQSECGQESIHCFA